jgi:hypothetical protein
MHTCRSRSWSWLIIPMQQSTCVALVLQCQSSSMAVSCLLWNLCRAEGINAVSTALSVQLLLLWSCEE